MANSGIEDLRYLIAEHRETNGTPDNHLNLQFSGTRQRVASWLGSPAPIGSLDFVTTECGRRGGRCFEGPDSDCGRHHRHDRARAPAASAWTRRRPKLEHRYSQRSMANLGGEFLLALDGPVLPTPSWKAVIEVNDSAQFEITLERLVQTVNSHAQGANAHPVAIDPSQVGGQSFYAVHDVTTGAVVAEYTFSDGYMIVAPTRALLMDALQTHDSGTRWAVRQASRRCCRWIRMRTIPRVAYQNLGPVLTPLLRTCSAASRRMPSASWLRTRTHRRSAPGVRTAGIEVASNSRPVRIRFSDTRQPVAFAEQTSSSAAEQMQ